MILHDVLAQMLFEEQKQKLDFVTRKTWQFHRKENEPPVTPRQQPATVQIQQQYQCSTC
ncbi:hypothetical protein [Brevibacillus sp. 179-C 1.1 NHS]|uniref:hypothetical protein n=1 Tax=Brevibacillus sp. 179-C 1.1 NHS TaxID=3235177 RepID=UPI0039A10186